MRAITSVLAILGVAAGVWIYNQKPAGSPITLPIPLPEPPAVQAPKSEPQSRPTPPSAAYRQPLPTSRSSSWTPINGEPSPFPIPAIIDYRDSKLPTENEALAEPITLKEGCSTVSIVEWRPTPGEETQTSPSAKATDHINRLCNLAIDNFGPFIRSKGLSPKHLMTGFYHRLSLMPGDIHDHGRDSRNLNDKEGRFAHRNITDEYVWGLTNEDHRISYMDNGVFSNSLFDHIFIHEMFHALSMFGGLYRSWNVNNEEAMAEKFVVYVQNNRH